MRAVFFATAAALLFVVSGCAQPNMACRNCQPCRNCGPGNGSSGPASVGQLPHGYFRDNAVPGGPPTAAYAYPYYTVRAPRDFLMGNPPSIGH